MLKPVRDATMETAQPRRHGRRRLRTVAMLPTLLTLGNLYFGFAATYCCGRQMKDLGAGHDASEKKTLESVFFEARAPSFLSIACWMLIGAMICDALDGRVARRTGQASKFGEQLDSLADMVSFGVAPALMMATLVHRELQQVGWVPFGQDQFGRIAVFIAALYVCCAGLRLARFTVETSLDEAAHKGFRGLPSPGAAGAVASLVFLHDHLDAAPGRWILTADLIARTLPLWTLLVALLMVSRVPYAHLVGVFLRRRPFWHVIWVLLLVPIFHRHTELFMAVVAWLFVGSGLVNVVLGRLQRAPGPAVTDTQTDATLGPAASEERKQAP